MLLADGPSGGLPRPPIFYKLFNMKPAPLGREPLERRSLAKQAAETLRRAILSGQVAAGTVLRQSSLAEELGVSVIPLREALCQLEGEGLVHQASHRGAVVADLSVDDVVDLVDILHALEALAFPRALPRLRPVDLEKAARALDALRDEDDVAAFGARVWDFREALLARAESPRLLTMLETLHRHALRYFALLLREPQARAMMLRHLTDSLELMRRRDLEGLLEHKRACTAEALPILRRLLPPTPERT